MKTPLYWHVDAYPTREAAETARGAGKPRSTPAPDWTPKNICR